MNDYSMYYTELSDSIVLFIPLNLQEVNIILLSEEQRNQL